MTDTENIRVLLVDDQPLIRTGFATILDTEPGIEVVGEASNGLEALEAVERLDPDVICLDVQMPVLDGIETTRRLTAEDTRAAILILTTFDHDEFLFQTLEAGASGFMLKTAGPEELISAVQKLAAGDSLLAPEVTGRVLSRFLGRDDGAADSFSRSTPGESAATADSAPDLSRFTERERDTLVLVAQGKSNSEIAEELFVAPATVKTHVSNILMKLGVKDRLHAVIWAYEHGVVNGS
ncbi:response regulator [Citricoccus muralis]|uniref:Response regulator transcription factor n=1 Tax=Citricoccus muralis TaxID=169134 RepID=A0ABY8H8A0_9MICC|nr:response regulator transcription factor [Citricoccus muralis]WFP17054.1 response regulator transcription factor [Citricoccus muralis]